jgi:EAL domain-containing protein (putative c-di-GMP-specific phosphodiesterase class I)/ActR/RegA family two-component response regulator
MTLASGLTVMVLEDHDFQRRTLARMLRSLGAADVLEAADGRQALQLIDAHISPIDLVVCDLNMPQMDGMEFIRCVGESKYAISIIICSAQDRALLSSVGKMAQAYGVRLLGVITKPVSLDALKELITQHGMLESATTAPFSADPSFILRQILDGIQGKQFEPFFQAKVELATGKIVGAEALARWRHPEKGLVVPSAFIPALEKSGKLDELTFQMLGKAAAACHSWRTDNGFDLTVSVNLSLVSLVDTVLADRITQVVRSTGLEPHHMVLEITETAAMTEVAPALENLARLRMRGFGLSVDDYGIGFSSLGQLTRVPFTELKIDQSFVNGCSENLSSRTIVQSSVQMANRLGINTVAEGVETQDDWDVLKAAGCNLAQGYFIAEPLDEKSFIEFCLKQKLGPTFLK